ncbi:sensor histidine kinase [Rubripirellula reticaptiva]|uniref:histidine kinase n=1 Tax=Rubripirellula reticaptiva TaxID=2528013 RepID=A0A5C6EGI6_9BACT|nr:ATP-binding protein [Rubripirellula reticaptiva]TWU46696.1 Sporulation kinase E [Rubripirellula reticaptiva]
MLIDPNLIRKNRQADHSLEVSPLAIVVTDAAGMVQQLNSNASSLFGYSGSDLLAKPLQILFAPSLLSASASQGACCWAPLHDCESGQNFEVIGKRKDDSTFSVRVTLYRIDGGSGDRGWVAIIDAMQDESMQQRWIQAERVAAVLQMVSGLAHESRNAMQRAQSCLELLELDLSDRSDLLHLTNRIRLAIGDLHRSYEHAANYAKPIVLKKSTIHVASVCRDAMESWIRKNDRPAPELVVSRQAEQQFIVADPAYMRAVFHHVLDNAIIASPPDSNILLDCQSLPNADLTTLRDQGTGLTAEASMRMFDPFFTTKHKGPGLGLSACRRIIEAHEGTIEAENHPAGGVEVKIWLPAVPAARSLFQPSECE